MTRNNTSSDYRMFFVNNIEAETEKAYKLNIEVSWNGNYRSKSFWFPKSVVRQEGDIWEIKNWFANKMEDENTFKGVRMIIECGFTFTAK